MGYRPNRWARSLVTRRSSMVGVVVPDFSHSYFAEITHGIDEVLGKAGYNLLLCDSWMDPAKEQAEIEMLVGSRVDGLIVASEQPERSPEVFKWLEENRVPFVLVDRFFIGRDYSAVRVDDLETGRLATGRLVELGHRRIAHIRGPRLSPASLRYRGYLETLRGQGIEIRKEYIAAGRFDIESGRAAMQKLLAVTPRPTAVFAGNDPMAIGALYAAREAGLDVPGDLSVVGAGNIEGAHHPNPFLTTVDWPRVEMGRQAAAMLLAAVANPQERKPSVEVLAPRLLSRQSTAAPGASATAC